jgi:peptidoglycan/LPS O-acetylase OafA/YrhL
MQQTLSLPPSATKQHFQILDGLRGLAAVAVVIFHFMEIAVPDYHDSFIAHAYLAVDFFFCLSGFVIAYAYDEKLKTIGVATFLKLRLIRLHPLVIIGSVIGLAAFAFDPLSRLFEAYQAKALPLFISSCLMIPYPLVQERYFNLFHLNPPTWSLFWEYIANIFYALVLVRLRHKALWIITSIAALVLFAEAYRSGNLAVGWGGDNYLGGAARVSFSFTAGILIYRSQWKIKNAIGFWGIALLLAGVFLIPFSDQGNFIIDPLMVIFFFPLLIILGIGATLGHKTSRFCQFSGDISYPLYMIHYPFIWLFMSYVESKHPSLQQMTMVMVLGVVALIGLAQLTYLFLDLPIRNYLMKNLKRKLSIVPIARNIVLLVILSFGASFSGLAQEKTGYNQEFLRLKQTSLNRLAAQVDEFNGYPNRPASDGPYNASNNKKFLLDNVPLFASSDTSITKVYNYRWWMISKHLKEYQDPWDNKKYWVVTEFFGVKPWASLSGAITCPAGQQFYDVRWLRDDKYLKSYADYFMRGSAAHLNQRENGNFLTYLSRPESHHFSSWMINGIQAFQQVHPDPNWLHQILPYAEKHQQLWDSLFTVKNPQAKTNGLYKILDLYDGMEFSLSAVLGLIKSDGPYSLYTAANWRKYYLGWETTGNAEQSAEAKQYPKAFRKGYPDYYLVRPSVNSYAYGNLAALSHLYASDEASFPTPQTLHKSGIYSAKAASLQNKALKLLWNKEDQFFNTYSAGDNTYGTGDYEARVRESVGYSPWYFGMIPAQNYQQYDKAWELFSSRKGFFAPSGMTTAEQQHPFYNEQAYAWNGRGWPFENSVVYKAYANYLRNYKKVSTLAEKELLYTHIAQLARLHGSQELNIGEWYIPSNGKSFGGEMDYFHSTFPDIIIEDLLGFQSSLENQFSIQPLLPEGKWDYFYLGNLRYHNHDIDIVWKKDWDTQKAGAQSRLCVWVDGKLAASSQSLHNRITVQLPN